ncbi:U-box domain-containing protein 33-like isoform X1 [Rhododendron vialii]|uniref:U-box domain-containing protein 33-like isoform X1 n=2 Tax=Rhododendron vialii TaxID=182163 RepID=UPI00265EBB62|nr:U-box domain-containing protein 33-like isoform X1 [Rhododendron vialii]
MAVVSRLPLIPQEINPIRYPGTEISEMMASGSEIVEESPPQPVQVVEEKMYIAVGKDIKESTSILIWALRNAGGRKICILHVHEPAQRIPMMGTKFPVSQLEPHHVRAYREVEREDMNKLLREYKTKCSRAGVVDELHIEMNSIEKGIVELINQHGIRKLVMGAAADKHYSRKMVEPKSKKARYVLQQAPMFCHIWFICKGQLVHTREGRSEGLSASPNSETGHPRNWRSQSAAELTIDPHKLTSSCPNMRRVSTFSSDDSRGETPRSSLGAEESSVDSDDISRSPSRTSRTSSSSVDMPDGLALIPVSCKEDHHQLSSPPFVLQEGRMNDELYYQLEQSIAEAETSRREAFDESMRRRKAQKDAIDAIRRAKASENLYAEELRQRKEVEEALARGKIELEQRKQQVAEVMEELRIALEHKSSMESQIANSEQMVKDLEQKMFSAVELLQKYKKERDELQKERDNALKEAEELRREKAGATANRLAPEFFSEFSFSEIVEATSNFDLSLKIGEGGYGNIYKGQLRHTQVAIKMLNSNSMQGPSEFQQEVTVLSKLRHPNLVTLIGACPEFFILVYEYLPNGSLEDRLCCKDNSPPLSWQTRIRIATELCSVLIFLHSCSPHSIVHGDLKPANILLDSNYVSKLSDFGICRILCQNQFSSNNTTPSWITETPKGTFSYMDPEFLTTGEISPKSDVFSFGIILLRLLTGRPALGITKEVKYALDKGNLKNLLDPTAGDWPFVQAQQLAHTAMWCCEVNRQSRPDLASDVWRVLERMRVSCGVPPFLMNSEEDCQIPPYFICPIFQEIMQDPHVAADGYTYELEALKGWLDGGHNTSPMTNLKLPHCNLVPNRALRSAIQEWLQQR